MKIPDKYIIEIGLIRKRGLCARCHKRMDFSFPNIQLCRKCRLETLDKFALNVSSDGVEKC